jgi:hypothetical protein
VSATNWQFAYTHTGKPPSRTVQGRKVHFHIGDSAKCPCGSRKACAVCCLTKNGLVKAPADTRPPAAITQYAHPRCYARQLLDCNHKLSSEHFVSASVLNELNAEGDMRVRGFPWQNDRGELALSPAALTAKILCKRHNEALSSLDATALRLFHAMDHRSDPASVAESIFLFSGHDIERWLLKVVCGLWSSGNATHDTNANVELPEQWVEVLFGGRDFADGQGLYMHRDRGHFYHGPTGVVLQVLYRSDAPVGIKVAVCSYELILLMEPLTSRSWNGAMLCYRPFELYTCGPNAERSIVFSWDGPADRGTIAGRAWPD